MGAEPAAGEAAAAGESDVDASDSEETVEASDETLTETDDEAQ